MMLTYWKGMRDEKWTWQDFPVTKAMVEEVPFNLPITNRIISEPQRCRELPRTFQSQRRQFVNDAEAVHLVVPILLLAFFSFSCFAILIVERHTAQSKSNKNKMLTTHSRVFFLLLNLYEQIVWLTFFQVKIFFLDFYMCARFKWAAVLITTEFV